MFTLYNSHCCCKEKTQHKINQREVRCLKGHWRRIVKVLGCYEIWRSQKPTTNLYQKFKTLFESMKMQGSKSKLGTFSHLDHLIFKWFLTVTSNPDKHQSWKQNPNKLLKRSLSKNSKLLMIDLIVGKTSTMFLLRQYLKKKTHA